MNSNHSFFQDFSVATIAASVSKTMLSPVQRAQITFAYQDSNPQIKYGTIPRYTSVIDCLLRLSRQPHAMAYLWRGNISNIITYAPTQGLNFAFYGLFKQQFPAFDKHEEFGKLSLVNFVSGGLAGGLSIGIVYPLSGVVLQRTNRYKGFGISFSGVVPYRAVYFGMYDSLLELNPFRSDSVATRLTSNYILAQSTAMFANIIARPIDAVRRKMILHEEHIGIVDCAQQIYKANGWRAFVKGPTNSILFSTGPALVLVMFGEIKDML